MDRDPTVFVVDDDSAMLDSLRWLIESLGIQVETFSSPTSFLDSYRVEQPGCLVLDVRMPGMSGLDLQEELVKRQVDIPIIFITAHGDVPTTVRAFKKGAVDFIEKPFSDQVLLDRIQEAVKKDTERRRESAEVGEVMTRIELLTAREREVMELVVAGKANKVIARELGVSIKTVEAHRARVMDKMQADSIADLVKMAVLSSAAPATSENE